MIGITTTAPELSVSLIAALKDKPEMAFANAIGSVSCDEWLGLALAPTFFAAQQLSLIDGC